MTQIPLPLVLERHHRFETFVAGANESALAHLRALKSTTRAEILWLWGPGGSGKSHLLQACCADRDDERAMYLPMRELRATSVQLLEGLEDLDIIALDDVDAVTGDTDWDRALFGLYNRVQLEERTLVLAARAAPAGMPFSLPDLASRASGAVVYQLRSLNDENSLLALQAHARARGLDLPERAGRYLLSRVSRDMTGLCRWLDELDTASQVAKRRLTIPFIRDALAARP